MEYLLSAGIDIGTTTTHLVISRIGIAVERGWGTVPKAEIKEKTILYQSPIYFTPLADGQIDLPRVQTRCKDKYEMLTRPDLGRLFDDENKAKIKAVCTPNPDVQIYCGDGLSAPCIGANVPDLLPMLTLALKQAGITVGVPFFVRYCRVNTARTIGPLVGAKVTCVLIGERPGLLTDESMSAYIAYNARPDMSESDYTVVSNISRYGMAPVEAGAYIADVIQDLLQKGGK